jgi:hypothetical protein
VLPPGGGLGGIFLSRLYPEDSYAGGQAWVLGFPAGSNDPAELTSRSWSAASSEGVDRAFTADFVSESSVVPEPSTLALALGGGLALAGVAVRRTRR